MSTDGATIGRNRSVVALGSAETLIGDLLASVLAWGSAMRSSRRAALRGGVCER